MSLNLNAQRLASHPAHSAWVAASAGTGKTKVLTDRVLRLLLQGVEPSRILCLTFTTAAAAEMKDRIYRALSTWVGIEENALAAALAQLEDTAPDKEKLTRARQLFLKVLDSPEGLKIQTIHAFCQSLLRRFPLEAKVPPHFRGMDERTEAELKNEARKRLFTSQNMGKDNALAAALGELSWRMSEGTMKDLLNALFRSNGRFERLFHPRHNALAGAVQALYHCLGAERGLHEREVEARLYQEKNLPRAALLQAMQVMEKEGGKTDKAYAQAIANLLAAPETERGNYWEKYTEVFFTKEGEHRKSLVCKPIKDNYPQVEAILQEERARLEQGLERARSQRVARLTELLLQVGEAVWSLYGDMKQRRAWLDYNDLICESARLLRESGMADWVMFKLDGGIDHLLVDEAQDTSPEQWAVIEALSSEFFAGEGARQGSRTLFVVGDEKQSIYRFQGAEPEAFLRMQQRFQQKAEEAKKRFEPVSLMRSFRSGEAVLALVDAVFSIPERKEAVASIAEPVQHQVHRAGQAGRVEMWPEVEKAEETERGQWQMPQARKEAGHPRRLLAAQVADTIASWLASGRRLESRGRAMTPGDILVLVRGRQSGFPDALIKALKRRNIPVAGADRLVLTNHLAVCDTLALGDFLLLPEDDLTLAAVLKSPFIGLTEEQLFELAHGRGKKSLWQSLQAQSGVSEVCGAACGFLSMLLDKVDYLSPFALYSMVLEAEGGRKKLAARLGEEVHDPLDEFLSLALQYEQVEAPSLQGFLHWLRAGSSEIKRDMEQGQDVVRIMTVHGAKGLQAPVVIMPDALESSSKKEKILWKTVPEFWVEVPLWQQGGQALLPALCREMQAGVEAENKAEELRLLYVALTRAEDELYIGGIADSRNGSFYEVIKETMEGLNATASPQGGLVLEMAQRAAPDREKKAALMVVKKEERLPTQMEAAPAPEPTPPQPLTPSRMEGEEALSSSSPLASVQVERGRLIHALLQYLPELLPEKRQAAALTFLKKRARYLHENEQQQAVQQVLSVLEHSAYSVLFGASSRAEVPLSGVVEGRVISGQVDRLVVLEDAVWVADYKTNRHPPASVAEVPAVYLRQMGAYRALLEQVFPGRKVHTVLVWTQGPSWMEV